MPARASVQAALDGDATLQTIGVQATYAGNSVDTPGEDLFLVTRWETSSVAFKTKDIDRLTVWAHDKQRDYTRIGQALERVKALLTGLVHAAGADGWTLTLVEYLGQGPDLRDDGYGTVARYAEFTVVSRYTAG